MTLDLSQLTVGQIASTLRDFAIVGTLITGAWKARGVYEHGIEFFKRWTRHMDVMESGMNTLLSNHLSHMETDLAVLAGRKKEEVQK